jgi:serine/threonine-protein kinase RsbW
MTVEDDDQHVLIDEVVTLGNLTQLRAHVLRLADEAGLERDRAEDFAMAVNEAVTNAIRHAGGSGELAVVQDDQRRLIAEVRDHGPGVPRAGRIARPPPRAASGRGGWLIQELADRVEVRSDDRGTTVHLEMDIPSGQNRH